VHQPGYRAEYASDVAEVDRRLGYIGVQPPRLLVTDEIDGVDSWRTLRPLAVFERNPLLNPHLARIELMEVQ
jgi:hypothetical protein